MDLLGNLEHQRHLAIVQAVNGAIMVAYMAAAAGDDAAKVTGQAVARVRSARELAAGLGLQWDGTYAHSQAAAMAVQAVCQAPGSGSLDSQQVSRFLEAVRAIQEAVRA